MIVIGINDTRRDYSTELSNFIKQFKKPYRLIHWASSFIEDTNYCNGSYVKWHERYLHLQRFLKLLESDKSIDLYMCMYTDTTLRENELDQCKQILKQNNIQISNVKLYFNTYFNYNLLKQLIYLFKGIHQEIYIGYKLLGQIEVDIDFNKVDYNYILKDFSLQLNVISKQYMDKGILKRDLCALQTRILKEKFKDLTIKKFYEDKNIDHCVKYMKENVQHVHDKIIFEETLTRCIENVDKNAFLNIVFDWNRKKPTFHVKKKENLKFHLAPLKYDIINEKCSAAYFDINLDPSFKIGKIMNPFKILESNNLRKKIVSYVTKSSINASSNFYLLHNDMIQIDQMINHNNYILASLLGCNLPGEPVIWHMVFLYLLAIDKFEHLKPLLFNEIIFLGNYFEYYISFTPLLEPPIKEKINVCLWYITNVCYKAFPNTQQNVLRSANYVSGTILKFYKDVYDKKYEYPREMPLWQLWRKLHDEPKIGIFKILTNYFNYENYTDVTNNKFQIVLFQEKLKKEPIVKYDFLSQLNLNTVLNMYDKLRIYRSFYSNINVETSNITLMDEENVKGIKTRRILYWDKPAKILFDNCEQVKGTLQDVKINLSSVLPNFDCCVIKTNVRDKYKYIILAYSYLELFKNYCCKYKEYPENSKQLLVYLNEYIFKKQEGIPEVFSRSIEKKMADILVIYKEVMEKYKCWKYCDIANREWGYTKYVNGMRYR